MRRLLDYITGKKRKEEVISALDSFVKSDIPVTEENLNQGIVEILHYNGSHSSNGLLISDRGHFITARHCLEKDRKIRSFDGKEYQLEGILAQDYGIAELALAKINLRTNFMPRYSFHHFKLGESNLPVGLYGRWDGDLYGKDGLTHEIVSRRSPIFFYDSNRQPGDSGGVIVTADMKIAGIHFGLWKDYNCSVGIRFSKALELIDFYKRRLESRL